MLAVYPKALGSNWLHQVAPNADQRRSWQKKLDAENAERANRGLPVSSYSILDYTTLGELYEIAEKRWKELEPALGRRDDGLAMLRRVVKIRNPAAHARDTPTIDRYLALGISGDIRAKVTALMSTQSPAGEWFPRIDMVRDSFGIEAPLLTPNLGVGRPVATTDKILHPGDEVIYDCRGTDPQDRELIWRALVGHRCVDQQQGRDVSLRWQVDTADIMRWQTLRIQMSHVGTGHRGGMFDVEVGYHYQVLPARPQPGA